MKNFPERPGDGHKKNPGDRSRGFPTALTEGGKRGDKGGYVCSKRGWGEKVSREAHSSDNQMLSDILIRRHLRRFEQLFAGKSDRYSVLGFGCLSATAGASY